MSCKDNKHLRKRQEGFLKKTQKNKTHVRVSLRENPNNFQFSTFNLQFKDATGVTSLQNFQFSLGTTNLIFFSKFSISM